MRRLLYTTCVFMTTISCVHTGDNEPGAHSTTISVIIDPTDKREIQPAINPILVLFNCQQYTNDACSFRLSAITDKKLNPTYSTSLPDAATTERLNEADDAQFRNKMIIQFYAAIRRKFEEAYKQFDTTRKMAHSECWATINAELHVLSENKSTRRFLIVASDLMERSDVDAYKDINENNIKLITNKFYSNSQPPQSLQGITIFFIYQPRTRKEDKQFATMINIYKRLLGERGAKIIVQATNTLYEA